MLSDSDSVDSDEGIRFKTENVRNKDYNKNSQTQSRDSLDYKYQYARRHHRPREPHNSSSSKSRSRMGGRSSPSTERNKKKRHHSRSERRHHSHDKAKETKDLKSVTRRNSTLSRGNDNIQNSVHKSSIHKQERVETGSNDTKVMEPILAARLSEDKEKVKSMKPKSEKSDELHTAGPSLPPHMLNKQSSKDEVVVSSILGPALPSHLTQVDADSIDTLTCKKGKTKDKKVTVEDSSFEKLESNCDKSELEQSHIIGPALPPHLLNKKIETPVGSEFKSTVGPELPPHLCKSDDSSSENADAIGPSLPTPPEHQHNPQKEESVSIIGPAIPEHLRKKLSEVSTNDDNCLATNAEENGNESEDEEVYGPLPPGTVGRTDNQIALEERALQLKLEQMEPSKSDVKVREEWMLELPEKGAANIGLGPRQFRAKAGPDLTDRSCWTDTPNDKKKKNKEKDEVDESRKIAKQKQIDAKDAVQEEIVKRHKKKHKESLLETHQKKMKKQKQEEGPSERRPFSRELDLQVNRFDEAQKKSVLKKAQLLDDRFMTGLLINLSLYLRRDLSNFISPHKAFIVRIQNGCKSPVPR